MSVPALAVLAAALLTACGSGTTSSSAAADPPAAPKVLTRAHDGKTFLLRQGREVSLRLPPLDWREPAGGGQAVEVSPVDYLVDPGYREWSVEARRPGRVVLASSAGAQKYRVTLVVRR